MIEQDTVKLLRECDAGVKMGVTAINEVLDYVHNEKLKKLLIEGLDENDHIEKELRKLLTEYHDDGKEPNPMAKGMAWIKTNVKLTMDESDNVIADLITDGCNMGIKSLRKYLNQYQAADENSKNLAKRLIKHEEKLAAAVADYL
ncbi:MAG: hypothetical protein E7497_05990 [Ruminococcus sp.]|nr:hypothetical protein [Ruminococcus sp.]